MVKLNELRESIQQPSDNLALTAGNRAHLIGSQNGNFPAFGHHVENEMGGLWMHPIKLLDGFWLKINGQWLMDADEFINYPYYNQQIYNRETIRVIRTQFVPENSGGLLLKYDFVNSTDQAVKLDMQWLAKTDLSPVWYSDTAGIESGQDKMVQNDKNVVIKDELHNWYVGLTADIESTKTVNNEIVGPEETFGLGLSVTFDFDLEIAAQSNQTVIFRIAGSLENEDEVNESLTALADYKHLLDQKRVKYEKILEQSDLTIPDKNLEKIYAWVKCHMDWLTLDVPGFGRGLAAGIPEYSWWFGTDSAYTILGCLSAGFKDVSMNMLKIVSDLSRKANGNGRIIHEANTFGVVGNRGNTQETAHFIIALFETFLWSGNTEWLSHFYEDITRGLDWLLNTMDTDNDLFPEGYGIIEILGLNGELIDTAVYTCKALEAASEIAKILDRKQDSDKFKKLAEELEEKIRLEYWIEEDGLFGDIRTSGVAIYNSLDRFIEQEKLDTEEINETIEYYEQFKKKMEDNETFKDENEATWNFKNWVINTPIEMGIASESQAMRSFERLNSDEFIGEHGMYLSGIKGKSGRRMMTISTGVQIQANLKYSKTDEALRLINKIAGTFNRYLPGSISEMSPDYGCFVQAWTSYGVLRPFVSSFAGIQPNVYEKTIHFQPQLPSDWDEIEVKQVSVGDIVIDVKVTKENNQYLVSVQSKADDWHFTANSNVTLQVNQ